MHPQVQDLYRRMGVVPALLMTMLWYNFFIRGMVPQQHYWPVRDNDKCRSLKHAVEWGNNHPEKGVLKGFDQATNIILDESHERVYSTKDTRAVLVGLLLMISGFQYLNQWTRYNQAIDMVKKTPAYKNKLRALELERTGRVTNKKGNKQMNKYGLPYIVFL